MKKRVGNFAGIPFVLDDSVAPNEIEIIHTLPGDPFPPVGQERVEVHTWGVTRYKTMTPDQFAKLKASMN